ncbi:MFS transporter [Pseudomonas citronellolis]|uniref:MFS transporter n=1 Tax=Pseudomonas citronellolis TaxID=53408 RepID=UPI0023E46805|nr:MFS transporter [Pseudomonas citronellolis]MDF3937208.1 MFS transporter [Pseudomonas citronellolis]
MDTLLILGGLLLILAGYVWLVLLAFERGPLWGLACLLPPLAPVFLARHWAFARRAVIFGALGWIPLVVGLAMLAAQDPARLQAIVALQWLHSEPAAAPELAIELRGELQGEAFEPRQADLIDGVLSLREGQGFYASREVRIHLPGVTHGPLRLDLLPEDRGARPIVEISQLQPGQDLPQALRLRDGYSLHLDLQPKASNRLVGDFHLVLPAEYRTTLSGRVELYTDQLRYRDGRVDTRYDSADTLAYVLRDYLQRRFPGQRAAFAQAPRPLPGQHELPLALDFDLDGQPRHLDLVLQRDAQRGWVVRDDHYARLAPRALVESAPTRAAQPAQAPLSRAGGALSLQRLQAEPQRYVNRGMRVTTERGRVAEGIFTGFDQDGRVVIRRLLTGAGQASYSLRPSEISAIELLVN